MAQGLLLLSVSLHGGRDKVVPKPSFIKETETIDEISTPLPSHLLEVPPTDSNTGIRASTYEWEKHEYSDHSTDYLKFLT